MDKLFIILSLLLSTLQSNDNYQLGKGVQLGTSPIYLGGYASFDYQNANDANRLRIDDIAIMMYGEYDQFSFMSELEYKELYVKTYKNDSHTTEKNEKLHIERLYVDYNINDNYSLKVGKYNSPIGFWNLLPINVLRATSSNPVSSKILFPNFTTGLDLSYSSYESGEVQLHLLVQDNEDLDADYNNYKIDKHYGFVLSYALNEQTIKLNTGYFHKTNNQTIQNNIQYLLLSYQYESQKYQILAEAGTQKNTDKLLNSAAYIQGLYRFSEQHIGVLRLESYSDKSTNVNEEFAVLGYTYRPLYPVALKSEVQIHSKNELNKFLFSFSVLF